MHMNIAKITKNERGSAILIVLALLAILSTVAIMAVNQSNDEIDMSFNQLHEEQAFYIADAGVKKAVKQLNDDNTWRAGYVNEKFGDGVFSVVLSDSVSDPSLADTITAVSTGWRDETNTTVEATLVPEYKHPFKYAMFGKDGINLDRNTCTNSFNSDSGGYAATMLDSLGNIGSNGTVTSSQQVSFGGDIQSATPGGISLGAANTVNGDTTSTADSVDLDIIPSSEYDWAKSVSPAPAGISGAGFTYNNGSKDLSCGAGGQIILSSGTYYFNNITLEQGSQLLVAAGVTIYVNGDVTFKQYSTANAGGNPADLLFYSRGSLLQFDQGNIFCGAFYGPDAHIQYDQTTQVYGSLVGGSIQLDKGACFHYDRNLSKIKKGTTGRYFVVAWREI